MTSHSEADRIGIEFGDLIMESMRDWQNNAPRTLQSAKRVLGMSEMGGCREYIRATIAGDVKDADPELKWPAFLGTIIGDGIESVLAGIGFVTQETVTVTLANGIKVTGHLDIRGPNMIGDLKTRDGLDDVRREGPSFKEKAQISGYTIAGLDAGLLDENGTGHLIYLDRSGKDKTVAVWSVTVPEARVILEQVVQRLEQVSEALASGVSQGYLRDEPESWCWAVQCPFYAACWVGYTPTEEIRHARELESVARFVEYRDAEVSAKKMKMSKREELRGVEGVTPDGTIVRWTINQYGDGGTGDRLDVRKPKMKAKK